ncbi:hypothetical protein LIS44_15620 (plasmid) [Acinetobacter haemolyticus]|uniref:hypothetical protein n=1 Tax=unclassified Acinetobacter TaxID=196816 RepID=UPI0015D371F1|nr:MULTISPECIES: hypothetical protein [unclassified Acinetobacter]UDM39850.1 hypothetical protein LIS44_15620 [Acinetobacter haemolyticus]
MSDISVKKINKLIEQFEQEGNKTQALEMGYKTYAMLMSDQKFADKVTKSAENAEERLYKKIKIKLIPEKHHFKIK